MTQTLTGIIIGLFLTAFMFGCMVEVEPVRMVEVAKPDPNCAFLTAKEETAIRWAQGNHVSALSVRPQKIQINDDVNGGVK